MWGAWHARVMPAASTSGSMAPLSVGHEFAVLNDIACGHRPDRGQIAASLLIRRREQTLFGLLTDRLQVTVYTGFHSAGFGLLRELRRGLKKGLALQGLL